MKKLLLFIFFISFAAHSQNAQDIIDGLKIELKTKPDAKRTATIYSDLTWYYTSVSIDSALIYGNKAILESTKLNDSTLMAQTYSDIAAAYFRKGDYKNSKSNYLNAYAIRKAKKDFNGLAKININLGSIYTSTLQYKPAMKAYLDAIQYFDKNGNDQIVNTTKANVGLLFFEMKNYPKAIKYLNEAIVYQEKNNQTDKICTSYLTLGNIFLELKDTLKATKYYNKSMKFCKEAGDKAAVSSVYNNIGNIKSNQNKSKEANDLFDKAKTERDQLNSDLTKATLQINIAVDLIRNQKFEEAKKVLLNLKEIFINQNSNDNLLLTYKSLIPVYAYLNQPDSVNYYNDKSTTLQLKIQETSISEQTNELETKYQTAKKEKLLLQKEAEAKQKNTTILVLSMLAFGLLAFGYLIYRQQKLKNIQQEQEFELQSAIAKIENQNKLQEQRLSISRDLHDNIGAQLTFIISSVDNVKYGFDIQNEKLNGKLTNISSFAKDTIVELRDTIWAMNTNEITYEDLEVRIHNFIEKAKEAKQEITFSFKIDKDLATKKLSSVEGMNVYRTIQEAINNSLKYANAKNIKIEAKKEENQTKITITDDGIGFNETEIHYGNGLNNMKKRIKEIGGKLQITSSEKGTTIEVLI